MTSAPSTFVLGSFWLGLMEKQIKRLSELAKFLPLAEQQQEMESLLQSLKQEAAALKQQFPESVFASAGKRREV